MENRPASSGFSIVELAIVLAVLGLLAGGIVAGQNLIQRSKVSSVLNTLGKYRASFNQFRQQYQALPGDYLDATEQWGVDSTIVCPTWSGGSPSQYPVSTATSRVPKKETCNGGGNDVIDPPENFRAWQHLSNAGLIEGTFTGVSDATGAHGVTPGQNAPSGPFSNSGFHLTSSPVMIGQTNYYDQPAGNQVTFGSNTNGDWSWGPALTSKEQNNIDLKIDDGKPSTGALRSLKSGRNPGCTTSDADAAAEYNLVQSSVSCTIFMNIKPVQ